jgi:competence protein ComEA
MRSRRSAQEELAAISRRRLEMLSVELAGLRAEAESEAEGTAAPSPLLEQREVAAPVPGRHARRPVRASGRAAGWLHDRLPPTLQGRVRLTAAHLTVVALMVAAGLAVTAWWVVRADGATTLAPAATWSETSVSPGALGESPDSALVTPAVEASPSDEPAVVVVDVAGKVRRPGIATLPLGSRVVDALEAAGGARRGVDLTALNLARVLVDGEQIVVGIPPPGGVAAPAASVPGATAGSGPLVNINTADQAALEELPGVGPVTAAAILQWRADHGAFTAVDELMEVSGIGEATLAELAPYVTL